MTANLPEGNVWPPQSKFLTGGPAPLSVPGPARVNPVRELTCAPCICLSLADLCGIPDDVDSLSHSTAGSIAAV